MNALEPDRWQEVKHILGQVLEHQPAERAPFLDEACHGDEDLRREVESLLEGAAEAGNFIEGPLFPRSPDDPEELAERQRIGPYQLLRRLGQGGMGTVYLAARSEEFEQQVAIKLIKRGMDTDEIIGRFRHERQILAHLTHPHIARLLDGGTTADGRPYFVMEYIEGRSIRRYSDEEGLTVDQRLGLFGKVCEAVDFAHRNLVIHRDLKPANILVTPDGEPKLLDFGIAKLLSPGQEAQTTRFLRPVTPAYASPEQLAGRPVTTASDIYSLGVLLYELLTGRMPFMGHDTEDEGVSPSLLDGSRPSAAVEPAKPSTVVGRRGRGSKPGAAGSEDHAAAGENPKTLQRRLSGDLDHIVLKALRVEPEKRYGSVEQLRADLVRHQNGHPVQGRRGSFAYRSGKFLRRHSGKLLVAGILLAVGVGMGLAELGRRRAEARTQQAEARIDWEMELTDQFGEFLKDLLLAADPSRHDGQPVEFRELLDRGAASIDHHLEDKPRVKAAFLGDMGQVYRRLGEYERAEELLEECLEIRRREFPPNHRLVGRASGNLALVRRELGKYVTAEALAQQAVDIYRQHYPADHSDLAKASNNLAGLRKELGDFDSAVDLYRQALDSKRKRRDEPRDIATALVNLGTGLVAQGQLDQAEARYREALGILEELPRPSNTTMANVLNKLGALLRDRGELDEAEPLLDKSLALRSRVYAAPHRKLVESLRDQALLFQERGDLAQAQDLLLQTLAMQQELYRKDHPDQALTLRHLAALRLRRDNFGAAEADAEKALGIFRRRLPVGHWRIMDNEGVLEQIQRQARQPQ